MVIRKITEWKSMQYSVLAVALLLLTASPVEAKSNPPGCRNANAAAHNPNCQGGGGAHVTILPKPTTTNVQTVVVAPGSAQTGQVSGGSGELVPVIVTAQPQQTFTGYSPYHVPPLVPPLAPSVVPHPVPNKVPQATPYLVPNQIVTASSPKTFTGYSPYYVPTLAPTLAPSMVPHPVPNKVPQAIPNLVPSQIVTANPPKVFSGYSPYIVPKSPLHKATEGPVGGVLHPKQILLHRQQGAPVADGKSFVPPKPGRNLVYGYRAFYVDENGVESLCVLSGLGSREIKNQAGVQWRSGHSETLHFRSTSTAHLPSNRSHAGNHCLVSAKKRVQQ